MVFVKSLCFLLIVALAILVQRKFKIFNGNKKMCDLDDIECLTKAANNVYKSLVAGANGLLEPLNSLHVDTITAEMPDLKYKITNGTLTELKNCEVTKLKCNLQDSSFEYDLNCPLLFLYCRYEAQGVLNNLSFDTAADEKVSIVYYIITFKGKYALSISEKDKKLRATIKKHEIDTETKGKFVFENLKLIRGNRNHMNAAYEYLNTNWRLLEETIKSPIIEDFMKPVVEKINTYLKAFPIEEVISQE